VGGGAYPEQDLPTTLVGVCPVRENLTVDALKERLLQTDPPLIGRVEQDRFCLDPRTLADDEHRLVAQALEQALGH
jgi:L-seryl-tRNA(Ser) seleniumtransferase